MTRYFRRIAATVAAAGAVLAVSGAAASAAPPPSYEATGQCVGAPGTCVSPDFYADGGVELALAAPVLAQNAPVITDDASATSPAQDWHFRFVGTIGSLTNGGEGPYFYGLTAADYANFNGTDNVFQLQATPFGRPTNFCVANLNNTILRMRHCNTRRWQLFIQDSGAQAGVPFPVSFNGEGAYYFSVLADATISGHDAVTGNDELAPVSLTFPQSINQQNVDANDATPGS